MPPQYMVRLTQKYSSDRTVQSAEVALLYLDERFNFELITIEFF